MSKRLSSSYSGQRLPRVKVAIFLTHVSLWRTNCFDMNAITCQRGKLVPFHPTDAHHVDPMVAQNAYEIASPCFSRKVLLLNLLGKGYLLGRKEGVIKGRKNWGTNSDRFFRKVELGRVLKRCMRHQHGKAAPSTCFEGLLRHGEGIAMNFRCGRVLIDGNSCKMKVERERRSPWGRLIELKRTLAAMQDRLAGHSLKGDEQCAAVMELACLYVC